MKKCKTLKVITVIFAVLLCVMIAVSLLLVYYFKPIGRTPNKLLQAQYENTTDLFYEDQFHNINVDYDHTPEHSVSKKQLPSKTISVHSISDLSRAEVDELKLTWLGHSSCLIQLGDQNILIDPIIVEPKGFRFSSLPERISGMVFQPYNLPEIDVLCISHDHFDHLDFDSIKAINKKVKTYIVPLGVDVILQGWGIEKDKIHALNWWESLDIDGVTYTLTPAQHYSGRTGFSKYATLWGGFYMKDDSHSVYFTGDTGICDTFMDIYDKFGETDLMLADAGKDFPYWSHMFPYEAVSASKDVHAQILVPVHWGSYVYGSYPWYQPAEDTLSEAQKQGVTAAVPRIGETLSFDELLGADEHWWDEYK